MKDIQSLYFQNSIYLSVFNDNDLLDPVALADGIDHVHALGYFAENSVFSIQVRLR